VRRRKVLPEDEIERVLVHFRNSIDSGRDWEDTFPLRGKDGQTRWFLSRALPIRDEVGRIAWWFGTNTDITDQREQAEQIRLLMMELNHRSKNMLATVQALARRSAGGDKAFIASFEDRLRSLAVNQDILVRRAWREVPVRELVDGQLAFFDQAPGELSIAGPDCSLEPRAAEVVGMALHELATNSLKYGALAAEGGHVDLGWDRLGETFSMWWHESGGAPVRAPERTGFGTTVIRDLPSRSLDAVIALDYAAEGLRWSLTCDGRGVIAGREVPERA
jgi:two-component sensor histidine kinase